MKLSAHEFYPEPRLEIPSGPILFPELDTVSHDSYEWECMQSSYTFQMATCAAQNVVFTKGTSLESIQAFTDT